MRTQRCNNCRNCRIVNGKKHLFLACCGMPNKAGVITHADDGVVMVWNDLLKRYPCDGPDFELGLAQGERPVVGECLFTHMGFAYRAFRDVPTDCDNRFSCVGETWADRPLTYQVQAFIARPHTTKSDWIIRAETHDFAKALESARIIRRAGLPARVAVVCHIVG